VGASLGMGAAGALAQHAGVTAAFALVGVAGCLAALSAVVGSARLPVTVAPEPSGQIGCIEA
jgi:hypothetical protein